MAPANIDAPSICSEQVNIMSQHTIADIYTANDSIRERLIESFATLTDRQVSTLPDGEKWNVAQILEHVSMVESGMSRICSKLLSKAKAEDHRANGFITVSDGFTAKGEEVATVKLDAPEMVHPSNGKTISQTLAAMEENRETLNQLRPLFDEYDCNTRKFPHPYFGDLSAGEWLMLIGGHEARHLRQIRTLVDKIG